MLPAILAAAIFAGPTAPTTRTDRLAAYIITVNPRAEHARELAERIVWEADSRGLDVAMFAAICYLESRFRLYPHGGGPETHLAAPWQVYPSKEWLLIPRAQRLRLSRDVVVSTWRAATILAHHVARCGNASACGCRYNRVPCRRSYIVALYRQTKVIRSVISGN
jgi:hypothetical protein